LPALLIFPASAGTRRIPFGQLRDEAGMKRDAAALAVLGVWERDVAGGEVNM
jgi:hypothetical protein